MMTVTIRHSDGGIHVYEDVVGINFIDKDLCETVADRELSDKELKYIENAVDGCEHFPDDTDLEQIIEEMDKEEING